MPVPGANGEMDVMRIGERTRPRVLVLACRQNMLPWEKFAIAETRSPARESRALPRIRNCAKDACHSSNEMIVQTHLCGIMSASCTPES
jgi:hypothetical protein